MRSLVSLALLIGLAPSVRAATPTVPVIKTLSAERRLIKELNLLRGEGEYRVRIGSPDQHGVAPFSAVKLSEKQHPPSPHFRSTMTDDVRKYWDERFAKGLVYSQIMPVHFLGEINLARKLGKREFRAPLRSQITQTSKTRLIADYNP